MSDTSPLKMHRKGVSRALLLLAAAALLAGCLGATPYVPTRDDEDLFKAKSADKMLYETIRKGEYEHFVLIAVFRREIFFAQSSAFEQSSIPVLSEFGNAALLLVTPNQVLPMLRDPSLVKAAWFGPQGRLARLDPSLEFDMLNLFGKGAESKPVAIQIMFRDIPKTAEEKAVEAAGFTILAKAGPTFVISGPASGIPKLLDHDGVVYLEKGSFP